MHAVLATVNGLAWLQLARFTEIMQQSCFAACKYSYSTIMSTQTLNITSFLFKKKYFPLALNVYRYDIKPNCNIKINDTSYRL